jgi:hypothetical protein
MLPIYLAYINIPIILFSISLYIRAIIKGQVKPNRVTWIFWSIAPIIGSYFSYKSGVPIPYVIGTFMAGFGCLFVVFTSFFTKDAYWKTTKFDIWCGVLSAISILIWVTTKNGVLSLSFAVLADFFAGLPTMIKSWNYSETETIAPYGLGALVQVITFFIIKDFSFLNLAFPLYIMCADVFIMIAIKRKLFKKLT